MIREPGILDIRRAAQKTVVRYSGEQIGLDPDEAGLKGSPTRVVRASPIRHRSRNGWKSFDAEEGVSVIAGLIRKDGEGRA